MNDTFATWLLSGDTGLCQCTEGASSFLFMRVAKRADFDYLFSLRIPKGGVDRHSAFKYAGIYGRRNGLLYDEQSDLKAITQGSDDWSRATLLDQLQERVRDRVNAMIGNDRRNLSVTTITNSMLLRQQEYTVRHYAKERARHCYLSEDSMEPPIYRCSYEPAAWSEDSFLAYIDDPEGFADQEAAVFVRDNQEKILLDFIENDAFWAEYQALLADADNPVHCIKRIMTAMRSSPAKTVMVTIMKEGQEFTFKTEAMLLRSDCPYHYSSYHIAAQDRQKFKALFGRSADYYPKEIVRITYARSVLYEASI